MSASQSLFKLTLPIKMQGFYSFFKFGGVVLFKKLFSLQFFAKMWVSSPCGKHRHGDISKNLSRQSKITCHNP